MDVKGVNGRRRYFFLCTVTVLSRKWQMTETKLIFPLMVTSKHTHVFLRTYTNSCLKFLITFSHIFSCYQPDVRDGGVNVAK